MIIQHKIGRATVSARHPAKSRPVAVESRHAAIRVITYMATSRTTHVRATICFGVFFFIRVLLLNICVFNVSLRVRAVCCSLYPILAPHVFSDTNVHEKYGASIVMHTMLSCRQAACAAWRVYAQRSKCAELIQRYSFHTLA